MNFVQDLDVDPSHLAQRLVSFVEIAQAPTIENAVALALAVIEQVCMPESVQIVWAENNVRLLGEAGAKLPPQIPDIAALASLERGEIVVTSAAKDDTTFVPLGARSKLYGWVYLRFAQSSPTISNFLQHVASQLGPVLTLHIATERHHERIQHLQTLTEIGQLLSGVLDLDRLMEAMYSAACRVVDVANFYIAFYDAPTKQFELSYLVHKGKRVQRQFRWNVDEGLGGIILQRRAPLVTDNYLLECKRQGVRPRPIGDMAVGRAWVGIPLFANDVPIGIMNINSHRDGYMYSPEHVELLNAIGSQAAVALANARLFSRSERQAQQLATLNRIGRTISSSLDTDRVPSLIMEQVCELLDVQEGSLLLVDEPSGDLVFAYTVGPIGAQLLGQRVPRGLGLAGHVVQTGESVIANNVQNDARFYEQTDKATGFTTHALLAVPLRGVAGVRGVIEVMNPRHGNGFSADDRQMLEAVADQAVIALENARQFAQVDQALARRAHELFETNAMLQHNLQSLTALNALGMALTTSLRDPNEIFGLTARGVVEVSGATGACVVLCEAGSLQVAVRLGIVPDVSMIKGTCATVLKVGRPQLVVAKEHGSQTLLAVPLRAPQHVLGVLCVFYDKVPASSDQETVVLFATQAAAAVESINLFAEVRGARDQMASILASTREGMVLIGLDQRIALANSSVHQLTHVAVREAHDSPVESFIQSWEQHANYAADEWAALRVGCAQVTSGQSTYAYGYLNALDSATRTIEWAALMVQGSHALAGALLVLRDITETREAERLRQDLTNMIVHDLRSPLSSVMAGIDMLIKGVPGELNDSQRNVLGISYASSQQMLEMINTLLDISKLEDGRMPLALAPCPMRSAVSWATERLSTLAQERAILVQTDFVAELPLALIDRELVVRVVQNLLANAIKFSSRGSTVLIRAMLDDTPTQPMIRVMVSDRGVGIAPRDQEKVFAKFGQVGESRGGTGLGLTFCKLVVEAHGGQIWLESEPGQGSTFFFTVPVTFEEV